MRTLRLVDVRWIDTLGRSGWASRREVKDWLEECLDRHQSTVGWLLESNEKTITVAQSVGFTGLMTESVDHIYRIPQSAVIEVRELSYGKRERRRKKR